MEMQERAEQQVYGKYGTLAKKYLEEHNVGKLWAIENLSEYLHGIDRQADELYETMYAKLSQDERYKRTGQFMEDYHRQTAMQKLIEDEILNELVYVQWGGWDMRVIKAVGKGLFLAVVAIGAFIMNCIGAIICAITQG